MDLKELGKEIPYKWRVQSFSKFKPEATCVAYIDSRQVQDLLDEVVGPESWQDKYYECKSNLFCSIGIRIKGIWVWKTDCGVESNVDKQKGEASDAFKRAAVKWKIGRFLYSKKMVKLPANEKKASGNYPHIVDQNGKRLWGDLTEYINGTLNKPYVLVKKDVDSKWSGEIFNAIEIDGERIKVTEEQVERLKTHERYKPMDQQNQSG